MEYIVSGINGLLGEPVIFIYLILEFLWVWLWGGFLG